MRRMFVIFFSAVMVSLLIVTPALAAPVSAPPPAWGAPGYHWVRTGETLSSIGRLYGVNAWAIASANHLANPNHIYAGQRLYIPARGGWYQPGYPGQYPGYPGYPGQYGQCQYGRCHWVKAGETMLSIGRLYGRSPWSIASANGIYDLNRIYVGQRLVIP